MLWPKIDIDFTHMGLRYDLDIDLEPICYDNRFHQYDTIFMLCMPTLVHWSSCWWLRLDLDMDFTNRLAFSKNTDSTTSKLRIQQAKSVILSRKKKHHFFRIEPTKVWTSCKPQTKRSVSWANGAKPPKTGLVFSKRAHPNPTIENRGQHQEFGETTEASPVSHCRSFLATAT